MINAAARGKGWQRVLFFLASFLSIYLLGTLGWQNIAPRDVIPPAWVNIGLFAISAGITVPLFRRFADRKSLKSLGFEWKNHSLYAAIAVLFAIALLGTGSIMLVFAKAITFETSEYSFMGITTAVFLMIIVAIAEESVFRGYILNNLLASFNRWTALSVSALLFAFVHAGNPAVNALALVNVFIAGMLLGVNYIYTRNLVFAIVFHFSWNFLQGPVLGFSVSGLSLDTMLEANANGSDWLTGGPFGFEASVVQTILLLVATVVFALWQHHQFPQIKNPGENPGL
jgi:uncharacterized protein